MRLIGSAWGRLTAGIVLPLAVAAGVLTASPAQAETLYTLAQVASHNTSSNCWSAINGGVYDLTKFIPVHEGGPARIIALCGIDGSGMFNGQHGSQSTPNSTLTRYRIGALDSTPPPVPSTTYTFAQVQTHNSSSDCWSVVGSTVYNLTTWIPKHPGGPAVITAMCGTDGSASFNGKHGSGSATPSASAQAQLAQFAIGSLSGGTTGGTTGGVTPTPNTTTPYTFAQVQTHKTSTDCWTVIGTKVYNLTAWIPLHPGGTAPIIALCGLDGSASFNGKHGSTSPTPSATAQAKLVPYQVGVLSGTTAVTATGSYTLAQVKTHNTQANCWSAILGSVYNLTSWIGQHPGGTSQIIALCGTEGSVAFWGKHSGSPTAQAALAQFKVGTQSDYVPVALPAAVTVGQISTSGNFPMTEVAKHNTAADCWTVINGSIYGLSTWIPVHPGGSAVLTGLCGVDGTAAYNGKHGSSASAGAILAKLRIGSLTSASSATTAGVYTLADVAKHKTAADCWAAIDGGIYNLTKWIPQHPGGPAVITALCGTDGSAAYNAKHATSVGAATALATFKIGTLSTTTGAVNAGAVAMFTPAQVARHHYAAHCWSIVNGNVYNLSSWTKKHLNRRSFIKKMCGKDGSKPFNKSAGGVAKANKRLQKYLVGRAGAPVATTPTATITTVAATTTPTASGLYSLAQVKAHATPGDCWAVVSGSVYNLTTWITQHPGGPAPIKAMCGTDGTASFTAMHSSSPTAQAALAKLKIGVLG